MTDRWKGPDGKIILLSHTLTTRGSHIASLVKFRPVVQEEIAWQKDGQRQMDRKIKLLFTMRASHVASLVKSHLVI